jgi:hypothetical protein
VSHSLVVRERESLHHLGDLSVRCCQYDSAFRLWAEYIKIAHQALQHLPESQKLELGYETLITEPRASFQRLNQFLGSSWIPSTPESWAAEHCRDRAYAFLNNPELVAFYRDRQQHPLMKTYGYSELV